MDGKYINPWFIYFHRSKNRSKLFCSILKFCFCSRLVEYLYLMLPAVSWSHCVFAHLWSGALTTCKNLLALCIYFTGIATVDISKDANVACEHGTLVNKELRFFTKLLSCGDRTNVLLSVTLMCGSHYPGYQKLVIKSVWVLPMWRNSQVKARRHDNVGF